MCSLVSVYGPSVTSTVPSGCFRTVFALPAEEIPQARAEDAKAAHETLVELVAEGNDELMQEFFDQGTLPVADLKPKSTLARP